MTPFETNSTVKAVQADRKKMAHLTAWQSTFYTLKSQKSPGLRELEFYFKDGEPREQPQVETIQMAPEQMFANVAKLAGIKRTERAN